MASQLIKLVAAHAQALPSTRITHFGHRRNRNPAVQRSLAVLEARRLLYILGVRERTDKLVRELVLNDPAPFVPLVISKRGKQIDYEAKAVMLAGRRYIVCRNHQEAEKDAADRVSILAALERQLAKGDKALVGNTGYRRYLKTVSEDHFAIRASTSWLVPRRVPPPVSPFALPASHSLRPSGKSPATDLTDPAKCSAKPS
jgi:hypothetical protein